MGDLGPQQLVALEEQIEGLEAATRALAADPGAAASVRRVARALEAAAGEVGAVELAAGAVAIQRATDAQLARSAGNLLERVRELREATPPVEAHVLLVEDDETVATLTAAYLRAPGRTIHLARSAFDAETVLAEHPIDLVVLDLILPDRDGRDLLVQLRGEAATARLPILVLSGTSDSAARVECLAVGADVFLEKPVEPRELRGAVSRLLRAGPARPPSGRDWTTGLLDRVGLGQAFEALSAAARAAGTPLCLGVIRLETFDALAARAGAEAAERLAAEVAERAATGLGPGDALGRWARETLVALLPGRSAPEADALLREVVTRVTGSETLARHGGPGAPPTFGRGSAEVRPGDDLRDAISVAERAVFRRGARSVPPPVAGPDALELPSHRVLLVEDDRVTGTLVRHRLVRDGHEVVDFANGEDAFRWAEGERFDLAVLDVKVPGMDGFELLERLRRIPRLAEVPIIMLTGMGREADVIRGLELGADDYVLKPFSPTELLARVRRLLHARSTTGGAEGRRTGTS